MAVQVKKNTVTQKSTTQGNQELFGKKNFMFMLAGLVVLAIGFFLMAGGKNPDPKVFNDNEVYSPMRISVAPFLIILGFCIEIFAIMYKPKKEAVTEL